MAKIGELMIKIGVNATGVDKELKKATLQTKTFGQTMEGVGLKVANAGKVMLKSFAIASVTAGAALGAMAIKAGNTADELLTLSAQTGIATDTLQGLDYAARFVDVELESMQKGWAKVVKAMGKATEEGQKYIEISDGLNVSLYDSNDKLKTSEQMFYDSIDAIKSMKNETMQEIAAQELFGKSYQDLMPLMDGGSEALKKYIAEAKKLGLVISDKDLKALGKFDDAMERVEAQTKSLGMKTAVALLPIMEDLADTFQEDVVPAMERFLKKYTDNPDFSKLTLKGKIEFVVSDIEKIFNNWWNGGGATKIKNFGTKIASKIGDGFAAAAPTVGRVMANAMVTAFSAGLKSSPLGAVLLGAITGGAAGSIIPGLGTALGAGIGGVAGGITWGAGKGVDYMTDVYTATPEERAAYSRYRSKLYIDNAITPPGHNANGTNWWRGGLSWVGERGPELVNLPRGAKVLSNQQSMAMAGQTINHTGTVTHVFQTNDRQTVARIAEEYARDNRRLPNRVATVPIMA